MDRRLYESVASQLKQRIATGVYQPGDRLPGERELAEELGVSRVTIREAEIALQATGHIQIRAGSGAYVSDRPKRGKNPVPTVSALELTQARLLFESEAAALAARVISDEALARLALLVDVMSRPHPDDTRIADDADREFHQIIANASGNAAVRYTIESLWRMRTELPAVQEAHASVCSDATAGKRGREHMDILEALQRRDANAAREAMQEHFTRLLASMIDASEAQAVEALRNEAAESRARFLESVPTGGAA
ncbi:MAG: FadR/GntR family transcriptional regulator [Pseudomonadota bacterium]